MSVFKVRIEANGAAFHDVRPGVELARMLREVADRIETGDDGLGLVGNVAEGQRLRDINGNACGRWRWLPGV